MMRPGRSFYRACIAALAVVGFGFGVWLMARPLPVLPSAEAAEMRTRLAAGSALLAGVEVVDIADVAPVAAAIRANAGYPAGSVDDRAAAQLAEEVSTFLAARFGEDAAGLTRWREARLYQPRPMDELLSKWFIDKAYSGYLGRPMPKDISFADAYRAVIDGQAGFKDGATIIKRIALSKPGLDVQMHVMERHDPRFPRVTGPLGDVLDLCGRLNFSPPWWGWPCKEWEMATTPAGARVAVVAFVAEFADGARRPVAVSSVFCPDAKKWFVISLWHGRFSREDETSVRWDY